MRYVVIVALASALLHCGTAVAQESSQDLTLALDSRAFARLQARVNAQQRIRITTRSGQRLVIARPNLTTNKLLTRITPLHPESAPVDLGSVTVIEIRGSSAGTGALVGAGIGFASGFATGMAAASICPGLGGCSDPDIGDFLGAGTLVGAAGAAIGAWAGTIIGDQIPKWKILYRANQSRGHAARVSFTPQSGRGFVLAASVLF